MNTAYGSQHTDLTNAVFDTCTEIERAISLNFEEIRQKFAHFHYIPSNLSTQYFPASSLNIYLSQ